VRCGEGGRKRGEREMKVGLFVIEKVVIYKGEN
jgi:hypothetical protein